MPEKDISPSRALERIASQAAIQFSVCLLSTFGGASHDSGNLR